MTTSNKNEQQAGDRSWPNVTVYTTSWCPDCRASKRFLTSNGIPFTELDIEQNPESAEVVVKLNNGMRRVPTIVIEDGPVLVEPKRPRARSGARCRLRKPGTNRGGSAFLAEPLTRSTSAICFSPKRRVCISGSIE